MGNDTQKTDADVILNINFRQGLSDFFEENNIKTDDHKKCVKAKIAEFFNMKNVCFLFGAGTSSGPIPAMDKLYEIISEKIEKTTSSDIKDKFNSIAESTNNNLEQILGVLYSGRSYYSGL